MKLTENVWQVDILLENGNLQKKKILHLSHTVAFVTNVFSTIAYYFDRFYQQKLLKKERSM